MILVILSQSHSGKIAKCPVTDTVPSQSHFLFVLQASRKNTPMFCLLEKQIERSREKMVVPVVWIQPRRSRSAAQIKQQKPTTFTSSNNKSDDNNN